MSRIVRIYRGETSPPPPPELRLYYFGYEQQAWVKRELPSHTGGLFRRSNHLSAGFFGNSNRATFQWYYPVAVDLTGYNSLNFDIQLNDRGNTSTRARVVVHTSLSGNYNPYDGALTYNPVAQFTLSVESRQAGTLDISALTGNHRISFLMYWNNLGTSSRNDSRFYKAILKP